MIGCRTRLIPGMDGHPFIVLVVVAPSHPWPAGHVTLKSAQYQAHASGISDLGVRFSTHRSADGVTYRDLDQTADDSRGWNPYYRINMQPSYFPNFFKICARNLGAKSATVTLLIETDANVH
jgi:hypothetical protein